MSVSARLHEIARCRVDDRAEAEAIATTARACGCDVEVRGYPGGFLVIVESLEQSIALGERLQLVGRRAAA